jgi:triosephosphate isomerase
MREKIVAGNWKMNGTHEEAVALATAVVEALKGRDTGTVKIILAPPFVHLGAVRFLAAGEPRIAVAAQNCAAWEQGAYTGEVSAEMIRSVGAEFVILGHSERRKYFSETADILKEKTALALAHGLRPIFCCGETQDERGAGAHFDTVRRQLDDSLSGFAAETFRHAVVAYEPVWAIGTGLTATPEQAGEMHAFIRGWLGERFGQSGTDMPLLYGGSCNEKNAAQLFAQPDIDGGLIGGASLKADSFIAIATSFSP